MVILDMLPNVEHLLDASGTNAARPAFVQCFSPELFNDHITGKGSGGDIVPTAIFGQTGATIYLEVKQLPINPLRSNLEKVERAFGLSKDELSRVCGTTRKTIYNWLSGESQPQRRNLSRLFDLAVLAKDWVELGYGNDHLDIRQPIIDSENVFDLLCASTIDRELILFAGSRLNLAATETTTLQNPFK